MATGSISTDSDPPESVSGVGNDSPKFCSPKGAKSPVWAHFGFLLDRQGKRANTKQVHCFHCREVGAHEKAIVAYCNNTTNLQQHLCTWHPEVLPSTSSSQTARRIVTVSNAKQATLPEMTMPKRKLPGLGKQASEIITRALAEFVARDMRPISLVEGEGFRKLMSVTEPTYTVPSRKTVTNVLRGMQAEVRERITRELGEVHWVALTTDFWTSAAVESYLGVTVHFVTRQWKLEARVLQTREMPTSHTGLFDKLLYTIVFYSYIYKLILYICVSDCDCECAVYNTSVF